MKLALIEDMGLTNGFVQYERYQIYFIIWIAFISLALQMSNMKVDADRINCCRSQTYTKKLSLPAANKTKGSSKIRCRIRPQ